MLQKLSLFTLYKFKPILKRPTLIILAMIILVVLSFMYGLSFIVLVRTSITDFFQSSSSSSNLIPISITSQTFQGYLKRDILVTMLLAGFLSYLALSGFQKIIGAKNPFLTGSSDGYFFQKIPVGSMFAYCSARVSVLVPKLLLIPVVCFCSLTPMFFYYRIPFWHLLPLISSFFIGFEFVTIFGDLAYFVFQPLREGHNWMKTSLERTNPLVIISGFGVPAVFLQLASDRILLTFNTLSNFILLPFINVAVAVTGFLLRSGPTTDSWWALVVLISEYIFFNIITLLLAQLSSPTRESVDQLPVLASVEYQQKVIYGLSTNITLQPSHADRKGHIEFIEKGPVTSLLLRDFSAFRRINSYMLVPFILFLVQLGIMYFQIGKNIVHTGIISSLQDIYPILFITSIFLFIDVLSKFFDLSQNRMHPYLVVNKRVIYKEQLEGSIVILMIFSLPFVLINIFITPLVLIVLGGIAFFLSKYNISNMFIRMIILFFVGAITLALLMV